MCYSFLIHTIVGKMNALTLLQLGTLIRERRKSLNITQTELAKLCNLSLNGISKIEQGKSDIRFSTLQKIGSILGFVCMITMEQ